MNYSINWGLANNGGFQNALAMGSAAGRAARMAAERKEYRAALGVLATDPENQNALASVFERNPQAGIRLADRADDIAFGREAADLYGRNGQPQNAPMPPPLAVPEAVEGEQGAPDLSSLGKPETREDHMFLRMLRRDPKRALEIKSAMRDNFVNQMQAEAEFYGLGIAELSRATDQTSWTAMLQSLEPRAQQLGFSLSGKIPDQYPGPEGVKALMERAQPVKEQLDLLLREANIEADNARADRNTDSLIETRKRRAGEYERHNRASESNQRRGQDMTDARVRSERGRKELVGLRSGRGRSRSAGGDLPVFKNRDEALASGLPSGTVFLTADGDRKRIP